MTPQQLAALKTHILASPDLAPISSGPGTDYGQIAALLNTAASPDFWVYRLTLTRHDLLTATSQDGTTFTWGGSTGGYINRSQGERDAFREMFNSTGSVNPALANIKAAFDDIFSGAGAGAVANRAHIAAMSRRKATRAEKVLGTGTGSTGSPGVAVFEGDVQISDVNQAMAS